MDLVFQEKLEDVRVFLKQNVGVSSPQNKKDSKKRVPPKKNKNAVSKRKIEKDSLRVHHFQNVFGKPLEDVEGFKPPVYPKTKARREALEATLADNFIFQHLDETSRETLLDAMEPIKVNKGHEIIKQGDVGDYFYAIENGVVSFIVDGKNVGKGEPGTCFGEMALLYDSPRAATVVCEADCQLWRVDQMTVRKIKASYAMENNRVARDLTRKIDFLEGLSENQKNRFADALVKKLFRKGEMLVRKGDPVLKFVIIAEGSVRGYDILVGETPYEDFTLSEGGFIGQNAMIESGTPWAGNAKAETDGIAYMMSRENFLKILGGHNLESLVAKSGERNFMMAIPIIANTDLDPLELDLMSELIEDKTFKRGHVFAKRGMPVKKPAIYLLRTGSVTVKKKRLFRGTDKVLGDLEFFGDDELVPLGRKKKVIAKRTVVCTQDSDVGVLTLEAIRSVIHDVSRLGKKMAKHATLDTSITLDSLKRYKILGAGTFGQVWLVSKEDKTRMGTFTKKAQDNMMKTPYALKIQYKCDLIGFNQAKGVINEKNVMEAIDHPFVIRLVNTYKDELRVYMLMDFLQGGELISIIHTDGYDGIPEEEAVFYAAGILEGLSYMHRRKILHRDLKEENVLMDSDGYCVLVDLGFAKVVPDKTYTCCGTPIFMAPEVLLGSGHNQAADNWSLGVLIYDMLVGDTPFYEPGITKTKLYERIMKAKFSFPDDVEVSEDAKNLIRNLLTRDPSLRLGSFARGDLDIRDHCWFDDVDFSKLFRKELEAPWVPDIKDPFDVSQFDDWSKLEKEKKDIEPLSKSELKLFDRF